MVPIPYALTYKTTVRGQIPKLVQCEKCRLEYVYLLEATVTGEGTSVLFADNEGAKERSAAQAETLLQQNLAEGFGVVPCPECGTIQEHMIPLARERKFRGMLTGAKVTGAIGGILAVPVGILTAAFNLRVVPMPLFVIVLLSTALGLYIARRVKLRRYVPNDEPLAVRLRQGQQIAVSKEVFLKDLNEARRATRRRRRPDYL